MRNPHRKKIIVLTGAGISAESGIQTFRDGDGLWNNHRIEDVATPEGWLRNPRLVMDFYNQRRKQLYEVEPNAAHFALAGLENQFDVTIITQNVDDLHERAGSTKVLHLHGELKKVRSTVDPELIYDLQGWELKMGDLCEKGSQLRPHVVWFGEEVPNIITAASLTRYSEILIVVGTSLKVYPAASLVFYASPHIPKYIVDPNAEPVASLESLTVIREKATIGVPMLADRILNDFKPGTIKNPPKSTMDIPL